MTCMHSVILVIVFDCKCKSWSASSRQVDWASGGDFRLQDYDMGIRFLEFGGAEFFMSCSPGRKGAVCGTVLIYFCFHLCAN